MKQFPKLTHAEYGQRILLGQRFKGAGLYEPDHAPRGTEFFLVLFPGMGWQLKRRIA